MTAADRAISILRAGLAARAPTPVPAAPAGPGRANPARWAHSKCDFTRMLDDQPFPVDPPPSLVTPDTKRRHFSKRYGQWLYRNNLPAFNRQYAAWRAEQESKA